MVIQKAEIIRQHGTIQIIGLPHSPGIYLYEDRDGTIIYVGKAVDLFRRVHSYFDRTHDDTKTTLLVSLIHSIRYIQTKSEFEALLLEAKYIRLMQPKYNILSRDDKSPLYILIDTAIDLPTITLVRKPKKDDRNRKKIYFGPFSSRRITEEILRSIRRIIPYCTQKVRNGRSCFYTHLGLCDPCPSYISRLPDEHEKHVQTLLYRKHIRRIGRILSGKSSEVLEDMQKEMNQLAKKKEFEKAGKMKRQRDNLIRMIQTTYEPFSFETDGSDATNEETADLKKILSGFYPNLEKLERIECIDIATLFGEQTVASIVTFIDGVQDRSLYRKFKIRSVGGISDTDAMKEALTRRFNHPEWPYPDLLIVDGGKPQVSVSLTTVSNMNLAIPLVGIAKQEEQLVIPTNGAYKVISIPLSRPAMNLVRRIRDEAHRFVNTYHARSHRKTILS